MQLRLAAWTPDFTWEQSGLPPVPKPCTDKIQSYITAVSDADPAAAVSVEGPSELPLAFDETPGCSAYLGFPATAAGAGKIVLPSSTISSTVSSCCHRDRFWTFIPACSTKTECEKTDVDGGRLRLLRPGWQTYMHSLTVPLRPATGVH